MCAVTVAVTTNRCALVVGLCAAVAAAANGLSFGARGPASHCGCTLLATLFPALLCATLPAHLYATGPELWLRKHLGVLLV